MVAAKCSRFGNDIFVWNVATFAGDVIWKGTNMTQNKIPTDEEIFEEWRRTNGGIISDPENVWVECAGDSWIELIHLARAAGREEQRDRVEAMLEARRPTTGDLTLADKTKTQSMLHLDRILTGILKAIRAQGEEEKTS